MGTSDSPTNISCSYSRSSFLPKINLRNPPSIASDRQHDTWRQVQERGMSRPRNHRRCSDTCFREGCVGPLRRQLPRGGKKLTHLWLCLPLQSSPVPGQEAKKPGSHQSLNSAQIGSTSCRKIDEVKWCFVQSKLN